MVIRATATELELSGSPAQLRDVAMQLAQLKPGSSIRFTANQIANPAPYDRLLVAFEAAATSGQVKVSVVGDTLLATGSTAALGTFASFFEFEDGTPTGNHHHHEWWPGNEYIAPDSRPLVVRCD